MNWRATSVALASALLAAVAVPFCWSGREQVLLEGAPMAVVMVTRDLPRGEIITRAALDVRELPERYFEERHILATDLDRVLGARATTELSSGSSLLWSDLDVSQEKRGLSTLVRPGMRAFILPECGSFAGLLRPGDRVDVLFTPTAATSGTVTLLQSVLVLTVADDLGESASLRAPRASESGTITLSVSLEQAQRLAQNEGRGRFRLALRNPQDVAIGEETPSAFGTSIASIAGTEGQP